MFRQLISFPLVMALFLCSSGFSQNEHRATESFGAKLFTPAATGWQSKDILLNFEDEQIVLESPKDKSKIEFIEYSKIRDLEYSYSKDHRKISVPMALAANVFTLPLLLNQVENHWLTVQSERGEMVLNLDKDNYQSVLAAFQANAGQKVRGWSLAVIAVGR